MTALILLPELAPEPPFFITLLGGTTSDTFSDVAVDQATGEIFVAGYFDAAGTSGNDAVLAKFSNDGALQWQNGIRSASDPGASSNDRAYGISINGSDLFLSGQRTFATHWVSKLNLSGVIQWQREIGGASPPSNPGFTNISDGTDMYTAGGHNPGGGASPVMMLSAKMNLSTGAVIWQRRLGHAVPSSSSQNYWRGSVIDGSSLLYLAGEERQTFGVRNGIVARYNASGGLELSVRIGDATDQAWFIDCALDANGDLYALGTVIEGGTVNKLLLVKYNPSTLAVTWQRTLGDVSVQGIGSGIWIDNSNNIFVAGYSPSGIIGSNDVILAQYDLSGNLQWHNIFGGTLADSGQNIGGDNNGAIIFICNTASDGAGGNDGLLAKVPDDGTALGVYGAFTYQAGAMTGASPSYTTGSPSTTGSSNSGDAAGTMGTYTSSLTEESIT